MTIEQNFMIRIPFPEDMEFTEMDRAELIRQWRETVIAEGGAPISHAPETFEAPSAEPGWKWLVARGLAQRANTDD